MTVRNSSSLRRWNVTRSRWTNSGGGRNSSTMETSDQSAEYSKGIARRLNVGEPRDAVILYEDVSAGMRAMQVLEETKKRSGQTAESYPSLWTFDHMEVPEWQAAAVVNVRQAGLIIISASREGKLPVAVLECIECCVPLKTAAKGVLVALLGPPGKLDAPDSPRMMGLWKLAERAGRTFVGPTTPAADVGTGAAAETKRHDSPPAPAPNAPARRILLIDDDSAMRHFSSDALRREGYVVDAVGGGEAAWKAIGTHHYDLLVTDNKMPGLTGLELVRKVRAAQNGMPVILASRGVCAEDLAASQWIQPAAALPKPFTSVQLLQAAATILAPINSASSPAQGNRSHGIAPPPALGAG